MFFKPFDAIDAKVIITSKNQGNLSPFSGANKSDFLNICETSWVLPRQVHSSNVAVIDDSLLSDKLNIVDNVDALVGVPTGFALAVLGADCPGVVLVSEEKICGVAHAGWRGVRAGVLENTVATMRELGAGEIFAVRGPCICPACYEFGREIVQFSKQLGPSVVKKSRSGKQSLDLPKAIELKLSKLGIKLVAESPFCTNCSEMYFSFRKDKTTNRQLVGVMLEF